MYKALCQWFLKFLYCIVDEDFKLSFFIKISTLKNEVKDLCPSCSPLSDLQMLLDPSRSLRCACQCVSPLDKLLPLFIEFWTIMGWPNSNRKQTLESFPFKHDCQPIPTWGGGPAEVHRQLRVRPSAQCGPNHDFGSFLLRYFKHTSHLSFKMTYLPKCPKCPLADLQQRKKT